MLRFLISVLLGLAAIFSTLSSAAAQGEDLNTQTQEQTQISDAVAGELDTLVSLAGALISDAQNLLDNWGEIQNEERDLRISETQTVRSFLTQRYDEVIQGIDEENLFESKSVFDELSANIAAVLQRQEESKEEFVFAVFSEDGETDTSFDSEIEAAGGTFETPEVVAFSQELDLEGLEGTGDSFYIVENFGAGVIVKSATDDDVFAVENADDLLIFEDPPEAEVAVFRALFGSLELPGYCPLSQSLDSTSVLQTLVNREALSKRRIPLDSYAPCDELLTFEPQISPVTSLVRIEMIALPPGDEMPGQALVESVVFDSLDLQIENPAQLLDNSTPLAFLDLENNRSRVPSPDGTLVLYETEQVRDINGGQGNMVAFTGLTPVEDRVLVVTVNAGADQGLSIGQVYGLFALTFKQASLRFLDQN